MTGKSKLHKIDAILRMRKICELRAGRKFFVSKARLNESQEAVIQKDTAIRDLLEVQAAGLATNAVLNPSLLRERAGYVELQHLELECLAASEDKCRTELDIRRRDLISTSVRKRLFEKLSDKLAKQLEKERLKIELADR